MLSELRFTEQDKPHRRFNPLTGEWVLVSPHRAKRPWQGQTEPPVEASLPSYDASCYLCPGNTRVSGDKNPNYEKTYVFDNDFAALKVDTDQPNTSAHTGNNALFQSQKTSGLSKVVCFSPDHSRTLPLLTTQEIEAVIDRLDSEITSLGQQFTWVQAFENKGAMMGCSQPHPHGQIWAHDFIPTEVEKKDRHQREYALKTRSNLLLDYAKAEAANEERMVYQNYDWAVLTPYWAAWPFETMVLPKHRVIPRFSELTSNERHNLAVAIKAITTIYDNLFECSFPYSMGWHFAPFTKDNEDTEHWQLHATFYPPLLRSSSVKKFMVGYEMFAEPQRDLTPEQAANHLRAQSTTHYTAKRS